jgi:hypothetical protein
MYLDLLNGHTPFLFEKIRKMKIPLKIKIFMLFLLRKVLLTKDNLAKRIWNGNNKCFSYDQDESIQHLFICRPLPNIIWRIMYISFNISSRTSTTNIFGNWLTGVSKNDKANILVGRCTLLWAI